MNGLTGVHHLGGISGTNLLAVKPARLSALLTGLGAPWTVTKVYERGAEDVQGKVGTWARREVINIRQEEWGSFFRGSADFVSAFFFSLLIF